MPRSDGEAHSNAPVAVVVVSWNTRDLLARCLDSLKPEVDRGRAEVWVVDNASSDGSAELVRDRYGWAHLIASPENIGFGRAANLGVAQAAHEWIAIANADVALRPGALDALLEAGSRDSKAGAIAPRLALPDGSTQHSVYGFPTVPFALALATGVAGVLGGAGDRFAMPGYWDTERSRRVPWAIAAFLLIRRSAWEQAGGFDERQWMYAEDLDLGWRLREAGWFTRYEPRAVVDHESSASTSQLFGPDLAPHWQRSTYGCIARRRGVARTWAVALLNFLGASYRWAYYAALARTDPGGDHAGRRDAWRSWAPIHLQALRGRKRLERLR
jgi:N-acetylglucosaminyl-diphospho-decaprenol L-rhamnosyltransferase